MATVIVSKPRLSKWFHNKSFVLSFHRFHHHHKTDLSLRVSRQTERITPPKDGPCPLESLPPKDGPCPLESLPPKDDVPCPPETTAPMIIPIPPMEKSSKDELREVFRYFDADGNGQISGSELRSFLASIGECMPPEEAQGVFNDLDAAGGDNLIIEFDDFVKLMEREGGDDDLQRAFDMFVDEKGSGCITPKGLQRMFHRLGYKKTIEECKIIIKAYDCDGDGVLGYPDFQKMMAC